MKGQSNFFFLFSYILITTLATINIGCNPIDEQYFERIDSLDRIILDGEKMLNIDAITIQNRQELIYNHLRWMSTYNTDTLDEQLGLTLAKYKGIYKAYKRFDQGYTKAKMELQILKNQALDLRTAIDKRELSKTDFKKFYAKEKKDAEENRDLIESITRPILSLEPDYQRISILVNDKLQNISLHNPRLKAILEEASRAAQASVPNSN
ncbi:MAG: hypothetical protein ACI8ZN_002006 [Bacteroidia bacterium]|jgi:hypothetical protein